jgi:hypothetical protein
LILYKKGIEAYRRGELQKASDLLMQVVEASEEDHRAWNALGVVLTKMGMHTDADVCFENALTLDPENEIYKRNREKNRIHVRRSITDIFSLLPFNQLPKNPLSPRYVLGIIGLFVLLILIISLPPLVVNTSPPAEISQTIAVTLEQTKDLILIKNMGGPGLDVLERFDITWNNQSLDALGLLPRFLGITAGSTLAIPLEELGGISDTKEINVRIHAIFRDHTSNEILTQTIHLPIEQTEPRSEPIISATSPDPRFGVGDVLLRRDDGAYVLVSAILSDNQYRVEELTRFNDGSFYVQPGMSRNVSMEEYENLTQKITSMQVPVDAQFRPGDSIVHIVGQLQEGRCLFMSLVILSPGHRALPRMSSSFLDMIQGLMSMQPIRSTRIIPVNGDSDLMPILNGSAGMILNVRIQRD